MRQRLAFSAALAVGALVVYGVTRAARDMITEYHATGSIAAGGRADDVYPATSAVRVRVPSPPG